MDHSTAVSARGGVIAYAQPCHSPVGAPAGAIMPRLGMDESRAASSAQGTGICTVPDAHIAVATLMGQQRAVHTALGAR